MSWIYTNSKGIEEECSYLPETVDLQKNWDTKYEELRHKYETKTTENYEETVSIKLRSFELNRKQIYHKAIGIVLDKIMRDVMWSLSDTDKKPNLKKYYSGWKKQMVDKLSPFSQSPSIFKDEIKIAKISKVLEENKGISLRDLATKLLQDRYFVRIYANNDPFETILKFREGKWQAITPATNKIFQHKVIPKVMSVISPYYYSLKGIYTHIEELPWDNEIICSIIDNISKQLTIGGKVFFEPQKSIDFTLFQDKGRRMSAMFDDFSKYLSSC